MAKRSLVPTKQHIKTLLLSVQAPYHRGINTQSYVQEFHNLAKTNGLSGDHTETIKLRSIDSAYYFTKGKLLDLKELCKREKIEHLFISEQLTTLQERNLEDFLHCTVFDRTYLILEIFEKAAHTAEGKTQVEIAKLEFLKTRLAGKGIHLSQQRGGLAMRSGSGETQKEKDVRHIAERILKLKKQLKTIDKSRSVQRKRRLDQNIPHACFIGYTNAGKSTLLNTLTKSNVLAENKLFATLDTTTRELYINGTKKGLLSDTVGFIQQLPHHLIEAFKSTLSELKFANLLIHVVDCSDLNWQNHIATVQKILTDLEIDKETLYVFNKVDQLSEHDAHQFETYTPHVMTSALSKEGIQPLVQYMYEWQIT